MRETPLKEGRKWHHHCRSDLLSWDRGQEGVPIKAKRVEKSGHEDAGRANTSCNEGHYTEKRLKVAARDSDEVDSRATAVREFLKVFMGDQHCHGEGVEVNTE